MACSGCGKRSAARQTQNLEAQAKYMNNRQLVARLNAYKKQFCQSCEKKDQCDYQMYVKCKKRKQ